jgi:hypothetical protein
METVTENGTHAPREDLVWLARLLLELAQERSLEGVLRKAIDAEAEVPGVALARLYLLEPGDICPTCPQRAEAAAPGLNWPVSLGRDEGAGWAAGAFRPVLYRGRGLWLAQASAP